MFDSVYDFLARIGYTHPIHPTEVHMPIGLVVGAVIFAYVAVIFRRGRLEQTVRHCIILAFIWVFPTILFGYMDWQHFYGGAWLLPIKVKVTMAAVLVALLLIAIVIGHKKSASSMAALTVYALCFVVVVVLGYFGGSLTYGGKSTVIAVEYRAGEKLFAANCSACHPGGGNAIMPNIPLVGSSKLASLETFSSFVHKPTLPDGKPGPMPPFLMSKLSDKELKELYDYITHDLAKKARQ